MSKSLHEKATEIIAKVLELETDKALLRIKAECGDDEELKKAVFSLYNEIRNEDGVNTNSAILKSYGEKTTLNEVKDSSSATTRIVKGWTKRVFTNKRIRIIFFVVFITVLVLFGFGLRWQVKNLLLKNQSENLDGQLKAQYLRLESWINDISKSMELIASDTVVIDIAQRIDKLQIEDPSLNVLRSPSLIRDVQRKYRNSTHYRDFPAGIISKEGAKVLMALNTRQGLGELNIGIRLGKNVYNAYLNAMTETSFVKPLSDDESIYNYEFDEDPTIVCIFLTPINDVNGELVGVLYATLPAEGEFSKILNRLYYGKRGEAYAFDKIGRMLSSARYTKEIQQSVLMEGKEDEETIYNIVLKDPGGNVLNGFKPLIPFSEMQLIEPVREGIIARYEQASDSIIFDPGINIHRNYYGEQVISKWLWWSEYDFGVVVEMPTSVALGTLKYFDYILGVLFVLIFILSLMLFNSNIRIAQFGKKIEDFNQLGQYKLKEKLGEGGFGEVYKAEHAFLKNPVAIKLLKKEFNGTDLLERFEREVKFSSMLQHPNTIHVFDYGTTKNEQFYYVMEYLDGISLDKVVQSHQPFPVARCISVLLQTCLSLREAHNNGLVHRDIKPQNIMVCNLGGEFDVVKVLDFGLVKNLETAKSDQTQINRIGGTPMFMAPERLRNPFNADHRVDIYSVGAVGVYMFSGQIILELISQKMLSGHQSIDLQLKNQIIEREDVPKMLKDLLYDCMDFDVNVRPKDMTELIEKLEILANEYPWTRTDAESWWKKYDVYL